MVVEIRYPKLGIVTANELHVPVSSSGRPMPTFLDLRSADVIHGFWVPASPARPTSFPTGGTTCGLSRSGRGFHRQCAEYCGTQHAKMLLRVYVYPGGF